MATVAPVFFFWKLIMFLSHVYTKYKIGILRKRLVTQFPSRAKLVHTANIIASHDYDTKVLQQEPSLSISLLKWTLFNSKQKIYKHNRACTSQYSIALTRLQRFTSHVEFTHSVIKWNHTISVQSLRAKHNSLNSRSKWTNTAFNTKHSHNFLLFYNLKKV